MDQIAGVDAPRAALERAGLARREIDAWSASPARTAAAAPDRLDDGVHVAFWSATDALLDRLPARPRRSAAEQAAATALIETARASRERFLAAHVARIYDAVTDGRRRFVRLEALVEQAAVAFPGLVPSRQTLAVEKGRTQADKDGHEVDHGLFLAHVLADRDCGLHLCHALLLPHPDSAAAAVEFHRTGSVDLGTVTIEREGAAAIVDLRNPAYLNAEDESTVVAQEIAVDVCTLDEASEIAVMRGARMTSGKYQGRRVYCTGINLTHLYHGKVSYLWYLRRELGWLNKVYRGIASEAESPDEVLGRTHEKLWISGVDAFAIGGGCQYLLVMDVNVGARDAYLTLPARKEGIVPGSANLRLPRFVGDRIARQAVMMERRIEADSPEGRMIFDEVVEPGQVDAAVAAIVERITRSGVVSASSNRKAFRVAQEPLDAFRRYMAVYAREQAYCHFSPALIRNLEQFWNAQNRKVAMKDGLVVGTEHVSVVGIDAPRTIAFMGDALRVYATPSMVLDVEHACRDLLVRFHDAGEDSVGARVEIDHLGPTLLGQRVTVKATVVAVEGPRVLFDVTVHDEIDLVGQARHTRFVVDMGKQAQRLEKKARRVADASRS